MQRNLWRCALCTAPAGPHTTRGRRRDICNECDADLTAHGLAWCATGRHKVLRADMAAGKARCKCCESERLRRYPDARNRAAYGRAWRAAHADRALAYGRAYRAAHRDQLNADRRAAYWRDPEAERARSRAQYRKHAARKRAWRVARYWRDPAYWRQEAKRSAVRRKLRILRGAA